MASFEDDVEPLEESRSRGSTPLGRGGASTSLLGKHERDESPVPDEELDTEKGNQKMWLVKVPRFLLEGWTKVEEEDKLLGTVRVYDKDQDGHTKLELLLPEHPNPAIPLPPSHPYLATNYPRHYDLRLTSEQEGARVRNLYAFRERMEGGEDDDDEDDDDDDLVDSDGDEDVKGKAKADDRNKKSRRVVSMVGMITNEAALKPQITGPGGLVSRGGKELGISPEYREVLRKRKLEASKPRHSVKVLDDDDASRNNMLTSGVGAGFIKGPRASLITQNRKTGNQAEKFARMPRNELMDLLFESFEEYPYWSIKGLRARVEQPEVYLRDVLSSIADLHKRGPYSGNWSLKPEYAALRKDADRRESEKRGAEEASRRQQQMGAQDPGSRSNVVSSSGSSRQEIKLEEGEDIGGDDEDDMDDVA